MSAFKVSLFQLSPSTSWTSCTLHEYESDSMDGEELDALRHESENEAALSMLRNSVEASNIAGAEMCSNCTARDDLWTTSLVSELEAPYHEVTLTVNDTFESGAMCAASTHTDLVSLSVCSRSPFRNMSHSIAAALLPPRSGLCRFDCHRFIQF